MIYFARCGADGPIKIGHTASDLSSRISFLQVGCPWVITIMGTMNGGLAEEGELLKRFSHLNMRGEWFHPARELLEFVEENASSENPNRVRAVIPFPATEEEALEDWPTIIGEILALNRWSQSDLAASLGMNQAIVSRWKSGRNGPGKSSRIVLRSILSEARKRRAAA